MCSFFFLLLLLCFSGFNRSVLFIATQSVPRFIQEITDVYAKEGETAVFECIYSGNPVPGIVKISYVTFRVISIFIFFFILLKISILILTSSLSLLINIDNF